MRALAKTAAGPGLEMIEAPDPVPDTDEVLIRILRTGICGTDLHIWHWDDWAAATVPAPMIIGHEFVGRVERIGERVRGIVPGDIVSGEGHIVCGFCRHCRAGRRHLCEEVESVGVTRTGAFAEYLVLPASNVWVHEATGGAGIDRDVQAIFDPFGNAVHTALHFPVIGEDVLITGAGPIGCMAAAIVQHAGARHVVVVEPNAGRRRLAVRMGATRAVGPEVALTTVMQELGMRAGFDVGLEMSGQPQALRELIAAMCHGGRIAMLGLPNEAAAIDWRRVVVDMLTIQGIYGREMYETWYQMSVLVQDGLDITPVITHRLPATDYAEGFAAMASGEAGKVILTWAEG